MRKKTLSELDELIVAEGWGLVEKNGKKAIEAWGETYPYAHPVAIHNHRYRNSPSPNDRYESAVKVHHYYWPDQIDTWNYWEEEIFFAHCEDWSTISLAAGASAGKSHTVGKIVVIRQLSDPYNNAAIVASTTLNALQKRVFGYIVNLIYSVKIPVKYHYTKTPTPQILFNQIDQIHSISALAAGVGADESHIRDYIGRHPKKKLLLVLDEAPDLSPVVMKSVANLEAGEDGKLQVWVIGNSLSKSDLHGALSTPKNGWDSVDHRKDIKWKTTQDKGVCLYFSPYRSPAIHEPDPIKRARLAKFLITADRIEKNKQSWGEDSIEFWRMTLGFWQDFSNTETTFTSKPFMDSFGTRRKSLWSGLKPLTMVAGFDPAFSTGGDKAILRFGILGQTPYGQMVLDFKDSTLLYHLKMYAVHVDSLEIQLADQIIDLLIQHKCSLDNVCFDVTGQGRTFAELVRQRAAVRKGIQWNPPIKIMSARSSSIANNQKDVIVKTPTELWDNLKFFIQTGQIAGIDDMAFYQMCRRLLVRNQKTNKIQLESKQDYRNRMNTINPGQGSSPDEADCASLCVYTAMLRHGFTLEQTPIKEIAMDFYTEKYLAMQQAEVQVNKPEPLRANFSGELTGAGVKGPTDF